MKGLGTTESVLTEIICTRDNAQLAEIRAFFEGAPYPHCSVPRCRRVALLKLLTTFHAALAASDPHVPPCSTQYAEPGRARGLMCGFGSAARERCCPQKRRGCCAELTAVPLPLSRLWRVTGKYDKPLIDWVTSETGGEPPSPCLPCPPSFCGVRPRRRSCLRSTQLQCC